MNYLSVYLHLFIFYFVVVVFVVVFVVDVVDLFWYLFLLCVCVFCRHCSTLSLVCVTSSVITAIFWVPKTVQLPRVVPLGG